jgi:GNAT superfamily N-acetyltransferase
VTSTESRQTSAAEPSAEQIFVVRAAHANELAAVGRLTELAYRADGHLEGDTHYAATLRDAAARAAQAELWVAADGQGSTVLGSVTYCQRGSPLRELAVRRHQAEFRMLAVDPAARGRGVGRALVQTCIERARSESAQELVICSMTAMKSAHRLYESLGFLRAPDLDWRPVPAVLLQGFRLPLRS